jgi:hypothetical protein
MTILEKFLHFAERLPAEGLMNVEAALAEIMDSYSPLYDFSANELSLIDQRVAETHPQYASSEDISNVFGKPFST